MEKLKGNERKVTTGLLIIYLLVITWIIVFKMTFSFKELPHFRNVNVIPFAGSAVINNQIDFVEIIGNVLIFFPFGLYLSMLKPNWSFLKKVIPIAAVSLFFEAIQFIFSIGGTDITDLMGNTLGGVTGIGIYYMLCKLFKEKTDRRINVFASIGTTFVIILLIVFVKT
ncbi:VanZ family protein [Jeotgalibaca sp. MA1X17-3]|uniref:VanZ family protein n=1 Tax=Jeotgalibaca sp. MA1X17-3 TaxID=2908211 RepID=UPI001F3085CA|nr:VanZ family protein [Jeotgalibaca sp. MA1X17-3]UJF15912.1 VanZ family protein [Jeotgalibaca sp. MA1X17-3]